MKKLKYSLIVLLLTYGCSVNFVSSDYQKIIDDSNKEPQLTFNGKSINIGEYIEKETFTGYINNLKAGTKWEYETKFNFEDKNIRFSDGKIHSEFYKYMNNEPIKTEVEIVDLNRNNEYIHLKLSNSMTWISNKVEAKKNIFDKIPATRNSLNFAFVWLLTGTKIGLEDSPFDNDDIGGETYYFGKNKPSIYQEENIFTKYKFIGTEDVTLNKNKYKGYKISYELRDIVPRSKWVTEPANDGFVKSRGQSIFVKGIGIVKDETDIELEFNYINSDNDDYVKQKAKYKVTSIIKNYTLK